MIVMEWGMHRAWKCMLSASVQHTDFISACARSFERLVMVAQMKVRSYSSWLARPCGFFLEDKDEMI